MTKVTLNNVGSLIEATTAVTTINNNFDTIETAFDNTLSRDGTTPNTMGSSLDMNSNNILNLPAATMAGEPVTFEVFEAAITGAGNLPLGGTTGQVLSKVSNASYDTAWTSESAEITAGTNIAITGSSPATISTVTNPTFVSPNITTPTGIVKGDVGLGNVDNTSDVTKNAAAVTLTNKTISGASNTLTARIANDISGLGTGIATALGIAVGTSGAPVVLNGAGGTPSSIVLTNATGTAASLTVGAATSAQNTQISNDTTTNATMFPTWVTTNSGNQSQQVSSTKLTFNPSTGVLSSTSFTGAGTGLTGTAASLTSGAVTTNANLTGDVTSSGNATTLTNAPVIAKVLTGYTSGAGTVSASDSILQAIQKLNGNDATNANLTGDVTSVGNATTLTNAPVIAKVLTGYTSGAGTVASTDSILQAIQKLNGNDATNANLTGDITSVGNATTFTGKTSGSLGQIPGTTTNDSASTGNSGEYLSATRVQGSAVSLTTSTGINIVSTLSLTAGDWDVWGTVYFLLPASTVFSTAQVGVSSTSATIDTTPGKYSYLYYGGSGIIGNSSAAPVSQEAPVTRFSLSGTTTIYLVTNAVFSVSTMTAFGGIQARRHR